MKILALRTVYDTIESADPEFEVDDHEDELPRMFWAEIRGIMGRDGFLVGFALGSENTCFRFIPISQVCWFEVSEPWESILCTMGNL